MRYYKYIAIILVYRNIDDLTECVASFNNYIPDCRIVVINSFYDLKSDKHIKNMAQQFDCDFLSVENKGYGAGNNAGITYALKNYTFDYLIVSNPDIIIQKFDDKQINQHGITAPDITTVKGKKQNPLLPWDTHYIYYFVYLGYKYNCKYFYIFGYAVNRFLREIFLLQRWYKNIFRNVYAAHGSFFIISRSILIKILPLYDESIFLFYEELILAHKMKEKGFKTYYTSQIKILHKEDGSIKLSTIALNKEYSKSNIYYYEHYIKGK